MKYDPKIHDRRSIRLKNYDYSDSGLYFVTMCTYNHVILFGEIKNNNMILNSFGNIVKKYWLKVPERFNNIELMEYVIMPNHIHGIINITVGAIHELPLQDKFPEQHRSPEKNELLHQDYIKYRRKMLLPKMIGWFKMQSAKYINILRKTPGTHVWQRNYYEHIIRSEKSYLKIAEYILNNPARWNEDEYYA